MGSSSKAAIAGLLGRANFYKDVVAVLLAFGVTSISEGLCAAWSRAILLHFQWHGFCFKMLYCLPRVYGWKMGTERFFSNTALVVFLVSA